MAECTAPLAGSQLVFIEVCECVCNLTPPFAVFQIRTNSNILAMKTNFFLILAFWLLPALILSAQNGAAPVSQAPYIEVVVASDRIWLLPEETPQGEVHARVLDHQGKVVLEKTFCSGAESWWLDISTLAPGKYQLHLTSGQREYFERHARKRSL